LRRKKTINVCCVFWLPCLPCENNANRRNTKSKTQKKWKR